MTEELELAVAAAAAGDRDAMRTLYEALASRVAGYLEFRGAEDPAGMTNDVFVRVLARMAEVTGGWPGFRAYVFTVAHGKLVDELRSRHRRPVHLEYEADSDPRTHASAEDQALDRAGGSDALAVLDLLPEDQRAVVTLRVLGELTVKETAVAIGRSEVAVKKLQSKALGSLRMLLSTEPSGPGSAAASEGLR
ncbi:RNA polymerase sigma factor [Cellulomonas sp. ICMP 17802]|uniref:RNA polymerase sigma factor n=1 Tax=Cellulomonas sp. ICMP 17802 TaxID=3239199 RepID=UPI00351BD94F